MGIGGLRVVLERGGRVGGDVDVEVEMREASDPGGWSWRWHRVAVPVRGGAPLRASNRRVARGQGVLGRGTRSAGRLAQRRCVGRARGGERRGFLVRHRAELRHDCSGAPAASGAPQFGGDSRYLRGTLVRHVGHGVRRARCSARRDVAFVVDASPDARRVHECGATRDRERVGTPLDFSREEIPKTTTTDHDERRLSSSESVRIPSRAVPGTAPRAPARGRRRPGAIPWLDRLL